MNRKSILRTPISYYGGKQKLAKTILSFLPEHKLYCEPFLGGAAIFFAKDPSPVEVVNDTNAELINFYRVCKNRFHDLQALVRITLHSRKDHDDAWLKGELPDDEYRAILSYEIPSEELDNRTVYTIRSAKGRPDGKDKTGEWDWGIE